MSVLRKKTDRNVCPTKKDRQEWLSYAKRQTGMSVLRKKTDRNVCPTQKDRQECLSYANQRCDVRLKRRTFFAIG
jgi:hypothetical protein